MRAFKNVHKRNRAVVVLLLPALVLITAIGWLLYSLNLQPKKHTDLLRAKSQDRTKDIKFMPAIFDEQNEIIDK